MQKIHFLLLKNFKNTESAQLWSIMHICDVKMTVYITNILHVHPFL